MKAKERTKKLELSLKGQQFFSEASEVESWLQEKNNVLSSTDFGRDRDAASKLLTKHKATELELDTYSGIVTEMGHAAQAMVTSKHPDGMAVSGKQTAIQQQLKTLQKLSTSRQKGLMESLSRHEYLMESEELAGWIRELTQAASSDDYGTDYEHLEILRNKFDDLKHQVETGSERFNQCQQLANKLINNESPYAADIESIQQDLNDSWQQLLSKIQTREARLEGAGEIHRFHRDASDALSRIQDKEAALNNDLGRDLNSAMALQRRHEGFVNDLVALEAQLQLLLDDAVRLRTMYPKNSPSINQQQSEVLKSWEALQKKSMTRREMLQASYELQRFLSQVRDLMNWSNSLRATMKAEEKVRDVASAQNLRSEHANLKAEIDTREENFRQAKEMCDIMLENNHYASEEIRDKCEQLLNERNILHHAWQCKQVQIDQVVDLQFFLRDVKQINTQCAAQEVALSNTDFGETIDTVMAHSKKHDAFEKLLMTQEKNVTTLNDCGEKLLSQNHFESPLISRCLTEVNRRREGVKEMCLKRRYLLDSAKLYAQFNQDVAEAEAWIAEKQKKLEADSIKGEIVSLEDKLKKLQKHQAFQAELAANEGRITTIKENGEKLLAEKHKASREICAAVERLLAAWNSLLQESKNRGLGLEEAQDILDFNNQVEKIKGWMREKEMMVQAGEMGRDYEHCLALQRKLDDGDKKVDDERIRSVNDLSDKLIRQGRSDTRAIQQQRDILNNKWKGLQGALSEYREHLAGALEIHLFNRDVDDTSQRVAEKAVAMGTEDTGRDLGAVEQLKRKQEALERDMTAIEGKLKEHDQECRRLVNKYPEMATPIRTKLIELQDSWHQLQSLAKARRATLDAAYTLHKFQADLKELQNWVTDTINRMDSSQSPSNISEAQAMIELHNERKAEIDGRQETFKTLKDAGLKLTPPPDADLAKLEELRRNLSSAWEERRQRLSQSLQFQKFKLQADQSDAWLASKEAFLNNDDLGDSIASVDELLKKHEAFEKALFAQLGRIEDVEKLGKDLCSEQHYAKDAILQRLQAVTNRRDKLKENTITRKRRLLESKDLQQFHRNVFEVEGWLLQKQQVARDENYRDAANLQSKIQKHAAFEAELSANKGRIGAVTKEGEGLIQAGHFAKEEIQGKLDCVEDEWRALIEMSAIKRDRLNDAYKAQLFCRTLEELEAWMDEIESQLSNEDHGKDLASTSNLLKRHAQLENDVTSHGETCNQLKETVTGFQQSNHFMKDELQERAQTIIDRYRSLQEPMQIRRDNLEDALLMYQLLRDIEDELNWLAEKEPLAASTDLGNSLNAVQSLQKKHQTLEAEIVSREPVVAAIGSRAQQMVRSMHFAAAQIEMCHNNLQEKLISIKDMASVRRLRLLDAVESQMFYAEASEAETWLKEKYPLLTSMDFGKDEDSVVGLLKKLEGLRREVSSFHNTVEHLSQLSHNLVTRGHFDSANIESKQKNIEAKLHEVKELLELRERHLTESKKFYRFLHDADEVGEWIGDQTAIADSEDYGKDVEHVELIIQKFENVLNALASNEGRVTNIVQSGTQLIQEGNPETRRIQSKMEETQQLWEDLKELAHARQDALTGAKQVHMYDRTADETISWIQEKDAALKAEGFAQDLESIQTQARKHQVFLADLAAVKEQVESVAEEGGRLGGLFPDAREHIEAKHEEVMEAWTQLLMKSEERKDNLQQAEKSTAYFDQHRELMAWINEMIAKITSPDLAQDVPGAENLIIRHLEHKAEINSREEAFALFFTTGNNLIRQRHVFSDKINDSILVLEQRKQLLDDTWENRRVLYDQNLDTQKFKRDAELLEEWIHSREPILRDNKLGDSIPQVEELIRKQEDFEKTIEAQEEKFNALKRITLLEQAFQRQLELEIAARQAEKERVEKERIEAFKRKELDRIADERRREGDRRRGQGMNGGPEIMDKRIPTESSLIQKSNSFVTMFTRGNDNVKRAESMKAENRKPRRTPSFATRRRTQSFRKSQIRSENLEQLPPVEIQGYLDRKHELQSGGKKAAVRSWKSYYTVLCGQLLCFFKDQEDFVLSKASTSPVYVYKSKCEKAEDYTKRKHVFRLRITDGSEYLFLAPTEVEMEDWVKKISFHAELPPNMQLMSYDSNNQKTLGPEHHNPGEIADVSSDSSKQSTPEAERRWIKPQSHLPPIPPRVGPPPIPLRSPTNENQRPVFPENPKGRPMSYQPPAPRNVNRNGTAEWRHSSQGSMDISPSQELPPPLPSSAPPIRAPHVQRDPWTNESGYAHESVYRNIDPGSRQVERSRFYTMEPQKAATLPAYQANAGDDRQHMENNESEQHRNRNRRIFPLRNLFRRQAAPNP